MITYLLEVSLCWAIFYTLYLVLLSRATFFTPNRLYLCLSLMLGLLLPLTPEWATELEAQVPAAVYYLQPITIGANQVEIALSEPRASTEAFSWKAFLLWVYLAGVALSSLRFSYGLYRLGRLYYLSEKIQKARYQLVLTPNWHLPFSFFKLLFWSSQLDYTQQEKEQIIRHEEAHMKGWHSLDNVIVEILKIIFWFSPPVYLYSRAIKAVHEYLADAAVLKTKYKKKHYGHLLLRQSQSGPQIAFANHFFHSQLKKRIIMMTKTKSQRHLMARYLLALPLVIGLAFAFAMPVDGPLPSSPNLLSVLQGEAMPIYPGCDGLETLKEKQTCTKEKLGAFIAENLRYPEAAKAAKKGGKVLVEFTVNTDGLVENTTVVKSAGYGMDEAALKVVSALPRWIPAQKNGKAVATKLTLPFTFELPGEVKEKVFKAVEEMPRFPGCEEMEDVAERKKCAQMEMLQFIFSNVKYPKDAKETGIEGTVVSSFIINKEGKLEDIKILRSVLPSLDKEVKRVVTLMNEMETPWIPGRQNGTAVNVQFNLPIHFRLTDEDKAKVQQEPKSEEGVYLVVEEMPRFSGCEHLSDATERAHCSKQQLIHFIASNTQYPEQAKLAGIEGTVLTQFIIDKEGRVKDVSIVKPVHPSLDKEAKRVIELMQAEEAKWIAGRQSGKAVDVSIKLPFQFKLPTLENNQLNKEGLKLINYRLAPNPTKGTFSLQFEGKPQPLSIQIYDQKGRELLQQEVRDFSGYFEQDFDLGQAPKGTLILLIRQDERSFTDQIVIQ